jgi:hypothetical protein
VLFSYLPPGGDAAVHDPGAGAVGTHIKRDEGSDLYHYSIDTRMMRGGLGWWHFVSEDADPSKRRAKVGKFTVRDVPRALLEREKPAVHWTVPVPEDHGFDMLGALPDGAEPQDDRALIGVGIGVAIGAVLAFL